MFELISSISKPGECYNEDAIAFSKNFLVVIDGATGLNNLHLTDFPTDAGWMARRLCAILEKNLWNFNLTIPEILTDAATTIKCELDQTGYLMYQNEYPSASVAIVRQKEDIIECFTLGDAPIFLKTKEEIAQIYDDTVEKRDQNVIDQMLMLRQATGCDLITVRKEVTELLLKNRREMNQKGAYYIFEATGAGIEYGFSKCFKAKDVQYVSLMSDGFFAIRSCYNIVPSNEAMMDLLMHGKAEELLTLMNECSRLDPLFNKYPRFKALDDASVIVACNKSED